MPFFLFGAKKFQFFSLIAVVVPADFCDRITL
jgi:hypothetical protein